MKRKRVIFKIDLKQVHGKEKKLLLYLQGLLFIYICLDYKLNKGKKSAYISHYITKLILFCFVFPVVIKT